MKEKNESITTTVKRRKLDLVVLSDLHLGTYGCRAEELNRYLRSIDPSILILNGDVLDMWQFKKYYFPKAHLQVIKRLIQMMQQGTAVYYVTGNHDDALRQFSDLHLGAFHMVDKMTLQLGGKRAWVFHGDVFDVTMRHSKWIARLGGAGYDLLMLLNRGVNYLLSKMGYGRISLAKRIKQGVKSAIRVIEDFEETATDLAIDEGYDYVICGHVHQPVIRTVRSAKGEVTYLNSGDWIDHMSALEYQEESGWTLYRYDQDPDRHDAWDADEWVSEEAETTLNLGGLELEDLLIDTLK